MKSATLAVAMVLAVPPALAQGPGPGAEPFVSAPGMTLPATYTGILPCADCDGIFHHLDLWPDGVYHLRREWLGRDVATSRDEIGRWAADPVSGGIELFGAGESPLFFGVAGPAELRLRDTAGEPIVSELNYSITSEGALAATELPELFLQGSFRLDGNAAIFTECLSDRSYAVLPGGDFEALEATYAAESVNGDPVFVVLEGGLVFAEDGEDLKLSVSRFDRVEAAPTCAIADEPAPLEGVFWRVISAGGEPFEGWQREPYITLLPEDGRLAGTAGCNRLLGSYDASETAIEFGPIATTMMACEPPLSIWERALGEALDATRTFERDGDAMVFFDETGAAVAEFLAVYDR